MSCSKGTQKREPVNGSGPVEGGAAVGGAVVRVRFGWGASLLMSRALRDRRLPWSHHTAVSVDETVLREAGPS